MCICSLNESPADTPSQTLRKLKQRVSQRLRKRQKRVSANQLRFDFDWGNPSPFWQARFHDFTVYSAGKKSEKLNYTADFTLDVGQQTETVTVEAGSPTCRTPRSATSWKAGKSQNFL
jgi:hypothetical protein